MIEPTQNRDPGDVFDVVVIGGSFSGSAFALLLERMRPKTRILIVERRDHFDRKVGEATVELSGHFLSHVLRLHGLLSREQLTKHGLRYWFTDGAGRALSEMSEVSSETVPCLPSFQLDRARLDESLLELAEAEGCEVARPVKVLATELGWPSSRITLESVEAPGSPPTRREVEARWVVDASGRQAFLARRMGLHKRLEEHPTAALWGRWKGVLDMDGAEVMGADPRRTSGLRAIPAARRLCTNHFCGFGWWCWLIPLRGGETSVGLVYDKRFVELPQGGESAGKREQYERFVRSQDGLRELLCSAVLDPDDFQSYDHLPYRTSRYMDAGWAIVGDAAAFVDPYYSPGLDHCSISTYATALLLERELEGGLDADGLAAAVATHNERFTRSYERYFHALYRDKYVLMGDAELLGAAFYLDTAAYFVGVIRPVLEDTSNLAIPVFGLDNLRTRAAYALMRFTARRLVALAWRRRAHGTYGRRNVGWYDVSDNFGRAENRFTAAHRHGLGLWLRAEAHDLWQRSFGRWKRAPRTADAALATSLREDRT